jgi:hydrogenase maturation factor
VKAAGGDVRIVYSPLNAVEIARKRCQPHDRILIVKCKDF